ncbi:hypothetical protein ACFL0Z_03135 [Patescibacteria group bacterium]
MTAGEKRELRIFSWLGFGLGLLLTIVGAAIPHWFFFVRTVKGTNALEYAPFKSLGGIVAGLVFGFVVTTPALMIWFKPVGLKYLSKSRYWKKHKRARSFVPLGILMGFIVAKLLGMSWECFSFACLTALLTAIWCFEHDWFATV